MKTGPALIENSITSPQGFVAAAVRCGLKKSGDDLAIISSLRPAVAAAVFTRNLVQAAPVTLSRLHLKSRQHRALLVNSGGANACTGEVGLEDARQSARLVGELLGCDAREVLVASTGVIGVRLEHDKVGIRDSTGRKTIDERIRIQRRGSDYDN